MASQPLYYRNVPRGCYWVMISEDSLPALLTAKFIALIYLNTENANVSNCLA